ncbi:chromosome segregation protein SMC [Larsenimonas rhizosphaerae]|uniref:Chromosome partition protein Smc n=1 Tax=Larsenimonas rhizosphaerae TaxID=2944682 RepID=A0AA41ZCC2_9GAMM|nr:chromosome segregation protein SMC [Larsenimonas rhizosphaerae]MCX2522707.1 chromosome segregation protein SMC [Larsenimonas rhizosphaerae]
MRLKSIKLAGFKSFVDPVTVPFESNMTSIVGPNGCGKSNVIDAVRWVMGESSAKMLRGESMADVIFNGSTGRKPVGQATIELLFDNQDGSLGGQYAEYREIAVKRLVTRDGQSLYYFNGQKCRRRDIADLFMGTGLGPRSYAIIGQGMISRLIEARPDELRATIEEAAGISRYKERRRETENRMRRTQENLERLDDLREELDKQLERLKRQADAARRYQELKGREHRLRGELALMRGRALRDQQQQQAHRVRELEIEVEKNVFGVRESESGLEQARSAHDDMADTLEQHQAAFYETGAAIARIEQSIEHARSREQQLAADLDNARRELGELEQLGSDDVRRLEDIDTRLEALAPEQETAQEQLELLTDQLEQARMMQEQAQEDWDHFSEEDQAASRQAERLQQEIRQHESRLRELEQQRHRRQAQWQELPEDAALREEYHLSQTDREGLDEQLADADMQRETLQARRSDAAQTLTDAGTRRDALVREQTTLQGELASLEALIEAALGQDDDSLDEYLTRLDWRSTPRLGEQLEVDGDWATAAEWVLSPWLTARVGTALPPEVSQHQLPQGELALLEQARIAPEPGTLGAHVGQAGALGAWLNTIVCADTDEQAWAQRAQLEPHQSVISPEGLWLGPHWVRRRGEREGVDNLLARRQRRDSITATLGELDMQIEALDEALVVARQARDSSDEAIEQLRLDERRLNEARQQAALKESNLSTRLEHAQGRRNELSEELSSLAEQDEDIRLTLEAAREQWQVAMETVEANSARREQLAQRRNDARMTLGQYQAREAPLREQYSALELERQRLVTERQGLNNQRERSDEQRERLQEKCELLAEQLEELRAPGEETRETLEMLLDQRGRQEQTLNEHRDRSQHLAERMRTLEQQRQAHEHRLSELREALEKGRMDVQALSMKADTQDELLRDMEHDAALLAEQLPDSASIDDWHSELERTGERIKRLGAINLAAIEEYDQQAERRDYLEAQHGELTEALETLEKAIRKIDQETRVRFRQTFDDINAGFEALFPRVFGGGAAWLTLTGDDLLETGVAIMARPPGKKNSTIHLLSGGEKALTALSLVFAIFKLNPAPFCMLDEVDAPLDDANVGRYARLVKEMSDTVQFIYITHNKIAMEAADQLMGVTMQEPGVSRLVAVGVEQAAELAQA